MIYLLVNFKTMDLILKFSIFNREEGRQAEAMLSIHKNIIFLYKQGCMPQ